MHAADSIEKIFRLQQEAFAHFRDVLLRENAALMHRDFQAIDACFAEHAQCVTRLEKLDHEFKAMLARAGASHAARGVEQVLATLPTSYQSRLQLLWNELLALVTACQAQNEVNSRLVTISSLTTEAALRILKGQGSVPPATYSPDGKVSAHSTQSAIATA